MKKILTIAIAMVFPLLLCAQSLTGFVTDEHGEPLIGAAVRVANSTVGTITDMDGRFVLDGREYTSLSAVAKVITGKKWNGRLFFGVKSSQ